MSAGLLRALSWLYRTAAAVNKALGRRNAARHHAQAQKRVPTVVVGNWVVGGAGKTPTTLAVLEHLKATGWRPGVVSRGYGRSGGGCRLVDPTRSDAHEVGDEPMLIARRAQVPVMVGRDRQRALQALLASQPQVNIVVSDDGLQHHRLWRDVEIAVVDERGVGNGLCLPAGPLRETLPRHLNPNTLVLYSAGVASLGLVGHVAQRRLAGVQTLQGWMQGEPVPPGGGWEALVGRPVFAAAGIAVPERFFTALRGHGVEVARSYPMPDHADWTEPPWPSTASDAVVTEKDAVKLAEEPFSRGPTQVWVARLDLELPPDFKDALDALLGSRPCAAP